MGLIIIYNDFLKPKLHVFRAMCICKPEMKNIPYPLMLCSLNICTPWILKCKFNFLEDMLWLFFNSRYVFHGLNTSYVTRRCYVNRK